MSKSKFTISNQRVQNPNDKKITKVYFGRLKLRFDLTLDIGNLKLQ